MAIISNDLSTTSKNHFIFIEDQILIKKDSSIHSPLSENDLPGEETARRCFSEQIISDWYTETEKDYSAYLLEKDSPVPSECEAIDLKHFFWNSKSEEEKQHGLNSPIGALASRAHSFLRQRQLYRFCPTCGEKLLDDTEETALRCPKCNRLFFPRIEPAVIVLVNDKDNLLLVKSKTGKHKRFSCIAGFIEQGESVEECVRREVMEETGVTIKNIKYVGSQSWPFPDQLMLAFTAEYDAGEIKIQEKEIEEAGWFSKANLPELYSEGSVAYNLIHGLFN